MDLNKYCCEDCGSPCFKKGQDGYLFYAECLKCGRVDWLDLIHPLRPLDGGMTEEGRDFLKRIANLEHLVEPTAEEE